MRTISGIFGLPLIYRFFNFVIGANRYRSMYVDRHVRPFKGDKILDIGCGPGDILAHLPPDIDYVGFDMSRKYIDSAKEKFGNRGSFFCRKITRDAVADNGSFDIVMANGVLHHLDDSDAIELFELARVMMKPSGRLVTIDGCYVKGQSLIARYLLSIDRGKHVRTGEEYVRLASSVFPHVAVNTYTDMLRIPYTHIIMECSCEDTFQ